MRRDQHLEAEQDGDRDRDRQEQPLLVHHARRPAVAGRHRIVAALMPRVAAQDAPRREAAAAQRAVTADRLDRVVAAAWEEPAVGADHRADRPLIGPHRADRDVRGGGHATPALASARRRSSCSVREVPPARRRRGRSARGRRPIPCARPARACAASFRRRRVRLRITALPIFFVTVKPSRAGPWSSRGSACSTTPGIGALRPLAAARRNSARRVRRPGGAKLGPSSGRQALAALGAAVGQHLAAADGGHAGTESVPPLADQLRRLIGALHGRFSDGAWTPARLRARAPNTSPVAGGGL